MPEPKEAEPIFTEEQLATPPSCPPLVGGFGTETPEYREAREAAGGPAPTPFKINKPGESGEGKPRAAEAKAPTQTEMTKPQATTRR